MSMIEPPDPDEAFLALMSEIEFDEPEGVIDYTQFEDFDLVRRFTTIKEELMEIGEMLQQHTDQGRDLHSQRTAILIELRKRGMM